MKDPKRLRDELEEMTERERHQARGNPDREAKAWANKLAAAVEKRARLQGTAAEGLITFDELGVLEEEREYVQRELKALEDHRSRLRDLERDKGALLDHYTDLLPEAIDDLAPQERHQVYKMLKPRVNMQPGAPPPPNS